MGFARFFVPLLLGVLLISLSVGWVAFIIPPFVPALVLVSILLLAGGVLELQRPYPDRRR